MKIWLCGVWRRAGPWEVKGVFSTETLALAACKTPLHFIGPLTLDVELPEETERWPNFRYPLAEEIAEGEV